MTNEKIFKKELVDELKRAAKMMKDTSDFEKKLFYFSASYGICERTYRYHFTKDVLLAGIVLRDVYNWLMERVMNLKQGGVTHIPLDATQFEKLEKDLIVLANCFANDEPIQEPLQDILTVGFTATGPGLYLQEKNMIE